MLIRKSGGPICFYCEKRFTKRKLTLDHFIPKSKGGPDQSANYVLACVPCNTEKADLEPERYFRMKHLEATRQWMLARMAALRAASNERPKIIDP